MITFLLYTIIAWLANACLAKILYISIQPGQWIDKLFNWQNRLYNWDLAGQEFLAKAGGLCDCTQHTRLLRLWPAPASTRRLSTRATVLCTKPGAPSELVYVYADCDTVIDKRAGKIKIPCPPVHITDTILLYKEKQLVNRAEIEKLKEEVNACNVAYAQRVKERQILLWTTIALGVLTLIRLLRRLWRIKLI